MKQIIVEKIQHAPEEAISYCEYIETVLYHQTDGYYTKQKLKIGKKGDFYTTSNVSDVYGEIIAAYFLEQIKQEGYAPNIYEFGAGNGRFAKAVIKYFLANEVTDITYTLVESSPFHRQLQKEQLQNYEQIKIVDSLDDLDRINGIVFSNELFDAFPVHVVEKFQDEVFEVYVGIQDSELAECYFPLQNEGIIAYMNKHEISLTEGQRYEIPLSVEAFMKQLAAKMDRCMIITVDYGYRKEELAAPYRKDGSLRGYYQHQQYSNVLIHPGEMDITYHIHFDEYIQSCQEQGILTESIMKQKEFLLSRNILEYLHPHAARDPFSKEHRHNRGILSLIVDGGISDHFIICIQKRG
ncbi:MAG: SAM-dependent methyltransferase [Bacillaceae bacterium]